ncbi:MAG: DUF998 domain-containing protein [Actinobacteria bacterium]|nr:DUF998 domain-containing protein [Actinomycetota bacterium]
MTRWIALGGLVAFVAIVVAEHALAPQLDPARHTISEYVNTGAGGVMVAGFLAWAASLAATAASVWAARGSRRRAPSRVVLTLLLATASAGLVLTAAFATQTSGGILPPGVRPSTGGRIHDLGSGTAMEALVGAVIASLVVLSDRRRFRLLAGVVLASSVVVSVVLLSVGHSVDGVRQRLLVAAGCGWQFALVLTLDRRKRAMNAAMSET